jgi:menaquinone-dependent protoporphyrinogen IX oxidase
MSAETRPSVLFVYFSYTGQTLKLVETMAEVLESRGCDVTRAAIEFTDPRYETRFEHFPMKRPFLEVVAMIPAELRRKPATIGIPGIVTCGQFDFVVVGAPTWWLSTDVPMRSFLESTEAAKLLKGTPFTAAVTCRRYWKHNVKTVRRLGRKLGGVYSEGIHFRYQGGQVRSLFSLLSYLGTGEYRERYHGIRIPPTNLQEYHLRDARAFAEKVAVRLTGARETR